MKVRTGLLLVLLLGYGMLYAEEAQSFRQRAWQQQYVFSENDIRAEIQFGRNLAARILSRYKMNQEERMNRYVALMGSGLAAQLGRNELTWHFGVLDTDDINAYACPGGYVFITRGAIQKMSNEAELAGVLAHEIGHVNLRHVVQALNIKGKNDSTSATLAQLIGGSTESFRVVFDQLTEQAYKLLFEQGLEQKDEFEADAYATQSLVSTNYQVQPYLDYLEKLTPVSGNTVTVLSKTHPSPAQRVLKLQEWSIAENVNTTPGKINQKRFYDTLHQQ
ncbi:MAG: M48 family metalloprotease [SAR324 cluster bacterium]|nr:M48 family metalloprotease [SAR324 cluster bacterium]